MSNVRTDRSLEAQTGATIAFGGGSPRMADTVAAPSVLEATVAAPSLGGGPVPSMPVSAERPGFRTTVLPRIAIEGPLPKAVHEPKLRYEEVRKLGEGGMGVVVQVQDNDIHRRAAIKRMHATSATAENLVRFIEEIRTIGRLEHPNIVPIHDVGVDSEGQYFFVMKYVDGETLESIIEKLAEGNTEYHRRFPFEKRVQIFQGILEAIHFAHAQGIVHRDIKPANVMVGRFGEVVVMDWGLAKQIRGDAPPPPAALAAPAANDEPSTDPRRLFHTRVGSLLGTPAYMSPEQARGQHDAVDERSDVYSLCVLFYEFLSLRHPLEDKKTLPEMLAAVVDYSPPAPSFVRSPWQPSPGMDLSHIVRKGIKKDPKERYQSVAELLERIQRRAEGYVPIQCHITFLKRMTGAWTHLIDRHPVFMTVVMAVCVLSGLAGTVFFGLKLGGVVQ